MLLYAIKSESEFELFRLGVTSSCGIISLFKNFQKLVLAVDKGGVLLVSAAVGTEYTLPEGVVEPDCAAFRLSALESCILAKVSLSNFVLKCFGRASRFLSAQS